MHDRGESSAALTNVKHYFGPSLHLIVRHAAAVEVLLQLCKPLAHAHLRCAFTALRSDGQQSPACARMCPLQTRIMPTTDSP